MSKWSKPGDSSPQDTFCQPQAGQCRGLTGEPSLVSCNAVGPLRLSAHQPCPAFQNRCKEGGRREPGPGSAVLTDQAFVRISRKAPHLLSPGLAGSVPRGCVRCPDRPLPALSFPGDVLTKRLPCVLLSAGWRGRAWRSPPCPQSPPGPARGLVQQASLSGKGLTPQDRPLGKVRESCRGSELCFVRLSVCVCLSLHRLSLCVCLSISLCGSISLSLSVSVSLCVSVSLSPAAPSRLVSPRLYRWWLHGPCPSTCLLWV